MLTPFRIEDSESLQSGLSEAELACIGDDPEALASALRGPGPQSPEEQARLLDCLHDETIDRLFLAGFVAGPLSPETSDCVREVFDIIDPRMVMTAGIEGDPGRAMAGSMAAFMATTACLNDPEWTEASRMTMMSSVEREAARCLMTELGGPREMAKAVIASQEVHLTTYKSAEEAPAAAKDSAAILEAAAAKCETKLTPAPGRADA